MSGAGRELGSPSSARDGAPLRGRTREWAELAHASLAAEDGRAQIVLLVGEPGIGKTRLAETFSGARAEAGAVVAWGRAWEVGGAPPYWPWIEALRSLCAQLPADAVRAALPVPAAALVQLLPDWVDATETVALDPAAARFRMFDAVAGLLDRLAAERELVVVLDDLHAADLGTLQLLHFVARTVRAGRLVVVGTHRDAEARRSPELGEVLARIAREGRWVRLSRLERDEIEAWIAELGVDDEGAWAERIWATSEGNPLFVVEALRLLREGRGLAGTIDMSDGVREVIRKRLQGLDAPTRELLTAGAIWGRAFDLARAADLASCDAVRAQDLVAAAARADVVVSRGEGRWEFTHVLLREVLVGELGAEARCAMHAKAAHGLLPTGPAASARLSELVHHLFAAGPHVDPRTVAHWVQQAAASAARALAFDQAIALLTRALARLEAEPATEALRCDLQLALAEAQAGAGQSTAVRDSARVAAALARSLGDPARLARAALAFGRVYEYAVVRDELVGLLEESLAALGSCDDALRAVVLARLAAALQPARDPGDPIAKANSAIEMARSVGDVATRLDVLVAAGSALAYFADPLNRVALDRELVALAERASDRTRELRGRLRLAYDLVEHGDGAGADAAIADYERRARKLGLPTYSWLAPALRGMRDIMTGRFEAARAASEEAAAIAARLDDANAPITFPLQALGAACAAARSDEVASRSPAAIAALTELADPWHARAFAASMCARAGRLGPAREALAWIASDIEAMAGRLSLAWVAEACVATDDRKLGAHVLRLLPPLANRIHSWSMLALVAERPITHALGILSTQQGRHDDAVRWLDDARVRAEAMGARPHVAVIELDLAAARLARGGTGDRDGARAGLDRAATIVDALALRGLETRLADLRGSIGGASPKPRPSPAVPELAGFSMRREGDVWAIRGREEFRLKDSRGLQMLARLLEDEGRELHVIDLMAPSGEVVVTSDAGPALDAEAIAAYRRRLQALRAQEHEAEAWSDAARLDEVRAEIDALATELAAAVGLGGRARRTGSTAEKARINVRQRLAHAIGKIEAHDPDLARHLRWAVRTGNFCSYDPSRR